MTPSDLLEAGQGRTPHDAYQSALMGWFWLPGFLIGLVILILVKCLG